MNLVDELHAIAAALRAEGIVYAVCGGVAVTIHGATRSTRDIDLLVDGGDVPRILEVLRGLGYVFAALPMTFDAGTARERHVQRVSKMSGDEHLVVDLLLTEAAFAGMLDDRVEVDLPEGPLSVASRSTLVRMKRLAGRAQDVADLEKLGGGSVKRELEPRAVAARLQALREAWVPMSGEEARRRLETLPVVNEPFDAAVARRLRELRALCELTAVLHRVER